MGGWGGGEVIEGARLKYAVANGRWPTVATRITCLRRSGCVPNTSLVARLCCSATKNVSRTTAKKPGRGIRGGKGLERMVRRKPVARAL